MRLIIHENYDNLSTWAAHYIVKKIKEYNPTKDNPYVMGLPTGSSPVGTYKELVRLHKEGEISFQNVITFNMDEYVGIVRTKDGLIFAKNEVEKIEINLKKYSNNAKHYFEALNMVQTALLIINSALTRKESIGCHYRIN